MSLYRSDLTPDERARLPLHKCCWECYLLGLFEVDNLQPIYSHAGDVLYWLCVRHYDNLERRVDLLD